ncbi:MAG: hypothetical protein JNL26_04280 [Gemmatimonadetes bacterium]|nr:hypothetical protein [Gemmatimonadota bacterium]
MFLVLIASLGIAGSDTIRAAADTVRPDSAAAVAMETARLPLPAATPAAIPRAPQPPRRRAVEYSEWYGRRLTMHRWGSYAMVPLFATEYWLGNKLLNDETVSSGTRDTHAAVASTIGVLFAANTVTGLWNLWDARRDPNGRGKRLVHSALLLAADAGFLYTASLADDDDGDEGERGGTRGNRATDHRNAALVSIGLSTVGTGLMWFFKD